MPIASRLYSLSLSIPETVIRFAARIRAMSVVEYLETVCVIFVRRVLAHRFEVKRLFFGGSSGGFVWFVA